MSPPILSFLSEIIMSVQREEYIHKEGEFAVPYPELTKSPTNDLRVPLTSLKVVVEQASAEESDTQPFRECVVSGPKKVRGKTTRMTPFLQATRRERHGDCVDACYGQQRIRLRLKRIY